jgi:hypothetical protein
MRGGKLSRGSRSSGFLLRKGRGGKDRNGLLLHVGSDDRCTAGRLAVDHAVEIFDGRHLLVGGQLPEGCLG